MAIFAQEESKKPQPPGTLEKGIGLVSSLLKTGPVDKRTRDPAKELTVNQMAAIKEFLALFRRRREELHIEMQRLTERLNQNHEDNIAGKILSEK